jgi:hypothetical protein
VSNAVLGSPGPLPPLQLDLFHPSARGVVPYFEKVPR